MTQSRLTQKTRLLNALQKHPEGIDRTQFLAPDVIDGGKPIINIPARIEELRNEGHRIIDAGRRHNCEVYRLVTLGAAADTGVTAPAAPTGSPAPPREHLTPWFCTNCRQPAAQSAPRCPACGQGLLIRISIEPAPAELQRAA